MQAFLASLGSFLFVSCLKQHCLPASFERLILFTFSVPGWVEQGRSGEVWEWLPRWNGSSSEFQPSGVVRLPVLMVTKVQRTSTVESLGYRVPGLPSQVCWELCAAKFILGFVLSVLWIKSSRGKKLQFCTAWYFLRKFLTFFKADNRSYVGKYG